jgi:hypothetical protein
MPVESFNRDWVADMVCAALSSVNPELRVNERHDICMPDGAKLSGSAYRIIKDKAYHHGTMLLASDLEALRRALKSPVEVVKAPSVSSVRSKVANLSPSICTGEFVELVSSKFVIGHGQMDVVEIPASVPVEGVDLISEPSWIYLKGSPHTFKYKGHLYHLCDGALLKEQSDDDSVIQKLKKLEQENVFSFFKQHKLIEQPVLIPKHGV